MKKAFSLLELVVVIIIISIIYSINTSRTQSNDLQEAATQVISHIRYTQHLAMVDDRFNTDTTNWFISRWQIYFHSDNLNIGHKVYAIYSDRDLDDEAPDNGEIALSNLSKKQMTGNSMYSISRIEDMDLTETYNILDIDTDGCLNTKRIFFDSLGRPHINNNKVLDYLLVNQCIINLCTVEDCTTASADESIEIIIEPETGYARIK